MRRGYQLILLFLHLSFLHVTNATPLNVTLKDAQPPGSSATLVDMHEVENTPGLTNLPRCIAPAVPGVTTWEYTLGFLLLRGFSKTSSPTDYCYDIYFHSPLSQADFQIGHCDGPTPREVKCVRNAAQQFDGYVGTYVRNGTELWVRVVGTAEGENVDEEGKVVDLDKDGEGGGEGGEGGGAATVAPAASY